VYYGGVWLAQKRQMIGSAVKFYSAINQSSTFYFYLSSNQPIIYLFCADAHTIALYIREIILYCGYKPLEKNGFFAKKYC